MNTRGATILENNGRVTFEIDANDKGGSRVTILGWGMTLNAKVTNFHRAALYPAVRKPPARARRDDSRIWIRSKAKEDATRSSNVLFRIKLLTRKTEI